MTSPVLTPAVTITTNSDPAVRSATVFAVTPVLGPAVTATTERPETAETIAAIVNELGPRFGGRVPCEVIVQCVDQAVRDLHESICRDALPEMAIRLAAVRLDRVIQPESEAAVLTASA